MESRARRRRHLLAGADGAVRLRRLHRRDARLLPAGPAVARPAARRPRHRAPEHADRSRLPAPARSLCGAADPRDRPGHLHLHHQRHRLLHQSALRLHAAVRRRARHHQVRRARLPRAFRHQVLHRQLLPHAVHPAAGDPVLDRHHPRPHGPRLPGPARQSRLRALARHQPLQVPALAVRALGLLHRPRRRASMPPTSAPSAPTSSRSRCCCSCCR